jgi:inhibitor of KinA
MWKNSARDTNMDFIPLGDAAALAYFPDELRAFQFAEAARNLHEAWLLDVVQAYASVAVYFDLDRTRFRAVAERLQNLDVKKLKNIERGLHLIPCCYEFAPDMTRVTEHTGLSSEEVIRLHSETEYAVYAIGFCPGFPYLGYLPPKLSDVPRLESPRLRVEPGSIGLTGRQTGVYTEERPGGWNLIGRTPLELVSVVDGYFPLRTGDRVRFQRIDQGEFERRRGQRI